MATMCEGNDNNSHETQMTLVKSSASGSQTQTLESEVYKAGLHT